MSERISFIEVMSDWIRFYSGFTRMSKADVGRDNEVELELLRKRMQEFHTDFENFYAKVDKEFAQPAAYEERYMNYHTDLKSVIKYLADLEITNKSIKNSIKDVKDDVINLELRFDDFTDKDKNMLYKLMDLLKVYQSSSGKLVRE